MRLTSTGAFVCLVLGMAVLAIGCGPSPTTPSAADGGTPGRTMVSLEIVGPGVVRTDETAHYRALAAYSDGTRTDVTDMVRWAPTAPPGGPQASGHSLCFTKPGEAVGVRQGETEVWAEVRVVAQSTSLSTRLAVGVVEPGTFEVTGVVTESGGGPLWGATVEVTAGRGQGVRATTDANGRYGIYGVAGSVQLRVSAEGFGPQVFDAVVTGPGASRRVELAPLEPPADVAGVWTMTLAPSPTCRSDLPEIASGRSYQVEFAQRGTRLQARLSGPTLTVHFQQPTPATVLGSQVRLQLTGDTDYGMWTSPDIYDRLSPTEQFGFVGTIDGVLSGAAISGRLDGDLVYLNTATDHNEPTWHCRATDHAITLRR
jgi:hypothetical protein